MKAGIVVLSLILLATTPLPVKAAEEAAAIPYNCVDSTVTKTGYYFEGKPESGIYAEFETKIGVETASDYKARVVDRSSPLNSVMDVQEVGDQVQVCLISFPETDRWCNPQKDFRGRVYRVYNYRLKAAYSGVNANHLCGGA
jgi:ribosomal protein L21E